jgi:5-methylcytosine-specific restriction endonuclease McrA
MPTQKDGLNYWCKVCIREKRKGKPQYNEYKRLWNKNKYSTDIEYRLESNTRCRLNHYLKTQGKTRNQKTVESLGCTISEYKTHLQNQFNNNMSWKNYGKFWEVDHIIPLSKGGSFHFSNTQPLLVTENRKKSDKT